MLKLKMSIVISIFNRVSLFKRSLKYYQKQLFKDFELVVVDDMSSDDILSALKETELNYQYIKIDSKRNDFPIFWGPSISNNIGFKSSNGEVIGIAGPEIILKEDALMYAYESAMEGKTPYSLIWNTNREFIKTLDNNPSLDVDFDTLASMPGAKAYCLTKNTYYWFFCASKKENIMKMNGCDEEYMRGICGDDDDFANRIEAFGPKVHDFRITGLHQDHSKEDFGDVKRIRRNNIWEKARLKNTKYLEDWFTVRNKNPVANVGRDWGSEKLVILRESNVKL